MVILWSSQDSGNLGDRPQSVSYKLKASQFPSLSLTGHWATFLWFAVSLKRVLEVRGGEGAAVAMLGWQREMMLVMISTNNWVPC